MKKPPNKTKAKPVAVAKPIAVKSVAPAPKSLPRAAVPSAHDPLHNLLRDRYARKICGTP
ncbi:MAG: hypothetical protein P4L57_05230 [Rhizomicrobium sp.]|nr:hypothetical protein [Rhizomicrobium sp.]